jgi:signal transduction histidine kinase
MLLDAGLALGVFAATLALLAARGEGDAHDLDAVGVALAALASLPLVARRRAPLAVFVVTAGASSILNALGYPPGPPLGATLALFFLASHPEKTRASRWVAVSVVVAFLFVHAGAVGIAEDAFPTVPLLAGTLLWGAAWVVGERVRMRRERIASLEERTRRERRLAAAEERTRIARDLHDSAGHAINVILVQAGAARLLAKNDPERARASLETIEDVARETLSEIDHLVRVLRDDDGTGANGEVIEPPVGLAALDTLAARHRSAGLAVTVKAHGTRTALSAGVDHAAYRIVQEALTNAARHGDGSASVEITFGRGALELSVRNPMRPNGATAAPGHGITGMRERAVLLGGSLDTSTADNVFSVRARLPYKGADT